MEKRNGEGKKYDYSGKLILIGIYLNGKILKDKKYYYDDKLNLKENI